MKQIVRLIIIAATLTILVGCRDATIASYNISHIKDALFELNKIMQSSLEISKETRNILEE